MVAKHCPICNRTSAEIRFYGEFCEKCAGERLGTDVPGIIEIERCKKCGRIKTKEGMKEEEGKSLNLAISPKLKDYKVKLIDYSKDKALLDIVLDEGREGRLSIEKEVILKYKNMTCESCYKRVGGYHEAVFQLRGDPERIERFVGKVSKYLDVRGEFIARVDKVEGGLNVFISSKKSANAFISERDIVATPSYTLMGLKSGKRIYKNTYSIRL